MIGYFDASALAKRYVEEPESAAVRRLLRECLVCTSRLSEVEIVSALVRRARDGSLSLADRDLALAALSEDVKSFYVVELFPEIAGAARELLRRHRLRASDAIQLASSTHVRESVREEVLFVAFDQRLNDAAFGEGLTLPSTP
ncbi:MAG TPA: type II toxin-antitoxin system VapC family toxin [Vicinamibacteria bacterium]|nr:type II toxin-antitoxin system VapC family toxin [Vicinamibacteria bacterium]